MNRFLERDSHFLDEYFLLWEIDAETVYSTSDPIHDFLHMVVRSIESKR